jgi:hypothetical protein
VKAAFLVLFLVLAWRVAADARTGLGAPAPAAWGVTLLALALTAPYLLPWYAIWFLPLLSLCPSRRLGATGVAVSLLLALTGVPAEPSVAPGTWRAMVGGVHYGAAVICLGLFALLVHGALRHRAGAMATSRSANALA